MAWVTTTSNIAKGLTISSSIPSAKNIRLRRRRSLIKTQLRSWETTGLWPSAKDKNWKTKKGFQRSSLNLFPESSPITMPMRPIRTTLEKRSCFGTSGKCSNSAMRPSISSMQNGWMTLTSMKGSSDMIDTASKPRTLRESSLSIGSNRSLASSKRILFWPSISCVCNWIKWMSWRW